MSVDWEGVPVIVGNDETRLADQRHERGQWIGVAALIGGMLIGVVCGVIGASL